MPPPLVAVARLFLFSLLFLTQNADPSDLNLHFVKELLPIVIKLKKALLL